MSRSKLRPQLAQSRKKTQQKRSARRALPRRLFGDPVLRTRARVIKKSDLATKELETLIKDMFYTISRVGGVGLAAPQVGYSLRLAVVRIPPERDHGRVLKLVLINPKIVAYSRATEIDWEGCLSLPAVRGQVPRAHAVTVSWLDEQGVKRRETFKGFQARVLQHEIDHLNGILYIDRMENNDSLIAVSEYEKLMKQEK